MTHDVKINPFDTVRRIGIFIFDDVEELDFVGPFEVFSMVNTVLQYVGKADAVKVILISETGKDITGIKGMRTGAHAAMTDIDALDIICIPGGHGARAQIKNDNVINWVESIAQSCEWVTSVCTGSFFLAKAGLTKGKRIATYWGAFDEFHRLGLEGDLQADVRYVRDGNVVTSAGVSAGIDMALWLVGQIYTPAFARQVARAMQYDPAPPYLADVE
ncbi:DJ-1/PfpI family protein [Fretibacter rubidus]|uniref:DJ-1/PfpI family protein n=1 Tax=Fretibacter rubidus TaxID=570162 RepID=UPI00352A9863